MAGGLKLSHSNGRVKAIRRPSESVGPVDSFDAAEYDPEEGDGLLWSGNGDAIIDHRIIRLQSGDEVNATYVFVPAGAVPGELQTNDLIDVIPKGRPAVTYRVTEAVYNDAQPSMPHWRASVDALGEA